MPRQASFDRSEPLAGRDSYYAGPVLLALTAIGFHAVAYHAVESFYATHLPHYDSMGSYTKAFEVITAYREQGFLRALTTASAYYLAWLQSFFALLGAPLLARTPQSLQLYNSLCVLLLMISLYGASRAFGGSPLKSYLLSLLVFLPDGLFDWWGGYQDLQRDPTFLSLLAATYFGFFALVWDPSTRRSVFVGVVGVLCVMSRGNAVMLMGVTLGPLVLAWVCYRLYLRDATSVFKTLAPAAAAFLVLVTPNLVYTYSLNVARYNNPYVAYALGDSAWKSLQLLWATPLRLMFGRFGDIGGGAHGTALAAYGALIIFMVGIAILTAVGALRISGRRLTDRKTIILCASGAWIIAVNIFLMCVVLAIYVKVGVDQLKYPFYPSLIGFLSFFFAVGMAVDAGAGLRLKSYTAYTACGLIGLTMLGLCAFRFSVRAPNPTPEYIGTASSLATLLTQSGGDATVAFLWHDIISIDTLRFYAASQGRSFPKKFVYQAPDGAWLDTAVAVPPGVDYRELQAALLRQLEAKADYVVFTAELRNYELPNHHMFLFKYGRPVIESVMRSPRFKPIWRYTLGGLPFVVLKSTEDHTAVAR